MALWTFEIFRIQAGCLLNKITTALLRVRDFSYIRVGQLRLLKHHLCQRLFRR
jgi:hypothetical protein